MTFVGLFTMSIILLCSIFERNAIRGYRLQHRISSSNYQWIQRSSKPLDYYTVKHLSTSYKAGFRMDASDSNIVWPLERVRSEFVDYFTSKRNHVNIKSSPCVPVNDPTLLFTNAGMNQFKSIFIGTVDPSSPMYSLTRAANSQKCIRAGGKHNDLDDVGKDTYHHTFFEMLGTWSFGDYFKSEAIEWAYDILVNRYKLNPDRLYASYFGGDEALGLPCDTEARDLWLQFLPPERVLPFDKKANFWEMGDTGPCGPCSEIHYDRIGGRDAAQLVNADDPDVIEIWNLVFIQFNRETSGELRSLPNKHIDTGMGLERITSIMQDKRSNYDTDAFMPLFLAIQKLIGCSAYEGKLGLDDAQQNYKDTAYRVIADHIRTLTFAITDGAVPSNEGRGYVLRRILRRAVRYGVQTLGATPGFFAQLAPVVVENMGDAFPELREKMPQVIAVIEEEEAAFSALLEKGVRYFNDLVIELKQSSIESQQQQTMMISGEKAFFMYDTLGFPVDLTQIMAAENGITVDVAGFNAAMTSQKQRSRVAAKSKRLAGRNILSFGAEQTAYLQSLGIAPTADEAKYAWDAQINTDIKAIFTSQGFITEGSQLSGMTDETVGIVLGATPFYAEAGGQVPDTGKLVIHSSRSGQDVTTTVLDVLDVQVYGGYVLHTCALSTTIEEEEKDARLVADLLQGLELNAPVVAVVDYQRRRKTAPNHTMTHVLNYALRKVLGSSVDQKGSLVSDEKLRFDFSFNRAAQTSELEQVESIVNSIIAAQLPVDSEVVPLQQAMAVAGLRAVFGEVYPDPVRVISVGPKVQELIADPTNSEWLGYSVEFCGGTHIQNTAAAESFVLLEETAVAKGIRRITGATGSLAVSAKEAAGVLDQQYRAIQLSMKGTAAVNIDQIDAEIISLRQQMESTQLSQISKSQLRASLEVLSREVNSVRNEELMRRVDLQVKTIIQDVLSLISGDPQIRCAVLNASAVGSDPKAIKRVVEEIKAVAPELSFLCISSEPPSKVTVFAYVTTATQAAGFKANEWVSSSLSAVGGKGGGKPGLAQGSAALGDALDLHAALVDVKSRSTEYLKSIV